MEMAPDGAITAKIQGLKDLMIRQPIDRKRGSIDGRILKLLRYGDQLMPEKHSKIEAIWQELKDFVRRQKEGKGFARNNYIPEKSEIKEVPNDLRLRYKSISDF